MMNDLIILVIVICANGIIAFVSSFPSSTKLKSTSFGGNILNPINIYNNKHKNYLVLSLSTKSYSKIDSIIRRVDSDLGLPGLLQLNNIIIKSYLNDKNNNFIIYLI